MALSSDKLPNRPLNGSELKQIMCEEFRRMIDNDWQFQQNIAYGKVAFTIALTAQLGQPHGTREWKSRTRTDGKEGNESVLLGETPMLPRRQCVCGWEGLESATVNEECPDCGKPTTPEEISVLGLERDVELENPNIDRVQHGLPIKVQKKNVEILTPQNPLPGEPLPVSEMRTIVTEDLHYDAKDFPKGKEPVDRDVSEKARERLGGMGLKKK